MIAKADTTKNLVEKKRGICCYCMQHVLIVLSDCLSWYYPTFVEKKEIYVAIACSIYCASITLHCCQLCFYAFGGCLLTYGLLSLQHVEAAEQIRKRSVSVRNRTGSYSSSLLLLAFSSLFPSFCSVSFFYLFFFKSFFYQ